MIKSNAGTQRSWRSRTSAHRRSSTSSFSSMNSSKTSGILSNTSPFQPLPSLFSPSSSPIFKFLNFFIHFILIKIRPTYKGDDETPEDDRPVFRWDANYLASRLPLRPGHSLNLPVHVYPNGNLQIHFISISSVFY